MSKTIPNWQLIALEMTHSFADLEPVKDPFIRTCTLEDLYSVVGKIEYIYLFDRSDIIEPNERKNSGLLGSWRKEPCYLLQGVFPRVEKPIDQQMQEQISICSTEQIYFPTRLVTAKSCISIDPNIKQTSPDMAKQVWDYCYDQEEIYRNLVPSSTICSIDH